MKFGGKNRINTSLSSSYSLSPLSPLALNFPLSIHTYARGGERGKKAPEARTPHATDHELGTVGDHRPRVAYPASGRDARTLPHCAGRSSGRHVHRPIPTRTHGTIGLCMSPQRKEVGTALDPQAAIRCSTCLRTRRSTGHIGRVLTCQTGRSIGTPVARIAGDARGNRGGHRQSFFQVSGFSAGSWQLVTAPHVPSEFLWQSANHGGPRWPFACWSPSRPVRRIRLRSGTNRRSGFASGPRLGTAAAGRVGRDGWPTPD